MKLKKGLASRKGLDFEAENGKISLVLLGFVSLSSLDRYDTKLYDTKTYDMIPL